jgi:hypothetical protein
MALIDSPVTPPDTVQDGANRLRIYFQGMVRDAARYMTAIRGEVQTYGRPALAAQFTGPEGAEMLDVYNFAKDMVDRANQSAGITQPDLPA